MREAIKALSLIGLVEVRQGDGTYLRKADSALLPEVIEWGLLLGERRTMDLVEARQEIEIVIAGLAARRRTAQDIEEGTRLLQRMGGSDDPRPLSRSMCNSICASRKPPAIWCCAIFIPVCRHSCAPGSNGC